jgi:ubiquinone/menaquinone biosynthesis C-methylase UbiE
MRVFTWLHRVYVHERRTNVLSRHVAELLPAGATVVDVGAGDGLLAGKLLERRSDLQLRAVEVLARPDAHVPVELFDGAHLDMADESVDFVLLIDVLHHATEPLELLREAQRVAREGVVVKDVKTKGLLARETLHLMERLANTPHGISIPETFWSETEWQEAFRELELRIDSQRSGLGLYPFPANLVFERSFHFIVRLQPR